MRLCRWPTHMLVKWQFVVRGVVGTAPYEGVKSEELSVMVSPLATDWDYPSSVKNQRFLPPSPQGEGLWDGRPVPYEMCGLGPLGTPGPTVVEGRRTINDHPYDMGSLPSLGLGRGKDAASRSLFFAPMPGGRIVGARYHTHRSKFPKDIPFGFRQTPAAYQSAGGRFRYY